MKSRVTGLTNGIDITNRAIWKIIVSEFTELSNIKINKEVNHSPFGMVEQVKFDNLNIIIQDTKFSLKINNDGIHFLSDTVSESAMKYIILKLEKLEFFFRYGIELSEELNDLNETFKEYLTYNGEVKKNKTIAISNTIFLKFNGLRFTGNSVEKVIEINTPTNIIAGKNVSENFDVIMSELKDGK